MGVVGVGPGWDFGCGAGIGGPSGGGEAQVRALPQVGDSRLGPSAPTQLRKPAGAQTWPWAGRPFGGGVPQNGGEQGILQPCTAQASSLPKPLFWKLPGAGLGSAGLQGPFLETSW